jgi:hypothetical protein
MEPCVLGRTGRRWEKMRGREERRGGEVGGSKVGSRAFRLGRKQPALPAKGS